MTNAPNTEALPQARKGNKRAMMALVAVLLLLALGFGAYRAFREAYRPKNVIVFGSERTTPSEVRGALAFTENDLSPFLDPEELAKRVRALDAVADAIVEIELPDTIIVHLVEHPQPGQAEGAQN